MIGTVKPQSRIAQAEREFWQRYAECAIQHGIGGHNAQWQPRFGPRSRADHGREAADHSRFANSPG